MTKPKNYSCTYSEEENQFIETYAGTQTIDWIAKRLDRPVKGLRVHMINLGIGTWHEETGTYSAKHLSEVIGVSYETVRRWILTKQLPAKKKSKNNGVSKKHKMYYIEAEDFWNWAENQKDLIQFNKIEKDSLLPEPEWVEFERKKQQDKPLKQKIWTTGEDKLLKEMYYSGTKQREIAIKLGRTLSSIEKRLKRLREEELLFAN